MSIASSPLILLILDGWGQLATTAHNAIAQAKTPQWHAWCQHYPFTELTASGPAVGLPDGQIGNSEVGHMHIGAGRIIPQDLVQINQDIDSHAFFDLAPLVNICEDTAKRGACLHVMGLLSDGGIHSHQKHLFAFLALARQHQCPKIALHLFTDGRDTSPQSAKNNIETLEALLEQYPFAKIASLSGRFYSMDRDKRWDRIEKTYNLLTKGEAPHFNTPLAAIEASYTKGIYDEFIEPCVIGKAPSIIQDGDNVFFFNFRADRAIQLTDALSNLNFDGFERERFPKLNQMLCMLPYASFLKVASVYPAHSVKNSLGEVLSIHGFRQLRIAETEKFPHVTFFFNGGQEQEFANEHRILISSPKVKTYNLAPKMRAQEITAELIHAIQSKKYDVIIANFANADMVGHCGEMATTIEAIESLDDCFKQLEEALTRYNAHAIITADHGNAEIMYDEDKQQAHTAHTLSPVPFLYIGKNCQLRQKHGSLIDVAPTVLALLGIEKPQDMTGTSLLQQE
ncbi:MAG: 2,3-bisphosphoglycerate-independent phosphoglycerate mutase [Gammaproteobacteria bacterium]|nr:2,3-bisphosphoglycerate-independent phosphoglycerate mutase [Gammaproteobacteria bacterium]